MGKRAAYIFIVLILALCLTPSVGMLAQHAGMEEGTGGNETLAALPTLRGPDGRLNPDWAAQMQDYVEDHYYLRQEMITAWSRLNASLLKTSIADNVVLGKDGWLYFGDTLPDYTNLTPMTPREVWSAARNLHLMSEACEKEGRRFLFTIAPNKNSLYPEHMPALTVQEGKRNRDLLAEALAEEGVAYLDLFALFGEQNETLYFARDSHWNSKGAALAADAVNEAFGRQSEYSDGPFSPAPNHKGDLYDMLYPAGDEMELDLTYLPELTIAYDAPIRSAENLIIMTHGGGTGSLLMFRDSFGNLLYPYLADSFDGALFSRAVPYRLDLAAAREADFVVLELVERNLRNLLASVPVMPAPLREAAEADHSAGTVAVTWEPSEELPGYVLAQGILPLTPDDKSPVLLETDRGWYEACLLEGNGFGLYLPEDAAIHSIAVWSGGRTSSLAVSDG